MRYVITGTHDDGRSYVVRDETLDPPVGVTSMWQTIEGDGPTFPIGDTTLRNVLPAGHTKWIAVHFAPHTDLKVHWTESVDFDAVISGRLELVLDEGSVWLEPGDCVVVAGVRHGWRTGDEACLFLVLMEAVAP